MATAGLAPLPKSRCYEEGEFVVYPDVAIFCEHERDGMKFDKAALERILARNNERIEETGDYCPIVIQHTRDDDSAPDPEVVGFAGPYRLGKIGNKIKKWAILAQKRFFKKDHERVKKYPRTSVEYWASKEDPTSGYFDPIAILGAETPHLDLGIRYSNRGSDMRCFRYSATAPCGSNTYVPGETKRRKFQLENIRYGKEPHMQLDQEALQQIVDAFTPVIEAKIADAMAGQEDATDAEVPGDAPMGDAPVGDAPAGEMPPGDATPAPMADAAPSGDAPPAETSTPPMEEEDAKKYQAQAEQLTQYRKERDDLQVKYRKACEERDDYKTRYQKLEAEATAARASEQKAIRYQKLRELEGEGYVLDVEEEYTDTASHSPDQFEHHLGRIRAKYQKAPIGGGMHRQRPPVKTGEDDMALRMRYSKEARELVEKTRKEGKEISFNAAYEQVKAAAV